MRRILQDGGSLVTLLLFTKPATCLTRTAHLHLHIRGFSWLPISNKLINEKILVMFKVIYI